MKSRLILYSFVCSVGLSGLKFLAYFLTHSTAVLTDALESVINIIASGFAFYSIYLSARPRDFLHPYGHGKVEFFSAGFEGALIGLAGIFIFIQGISHLRHPQPVEHIPAGLLLIGSSVLVNGGLGWLLRREGQRYNSLTLIADGRHLLSDALSSLLLVVGMGLIAWTGYNWLDAVLSMAFACLILAHGYQLVRRSVAGLMDEADLGTLERVVEVLNEKRHACWIDIHNLRAQLYGADWHIDCHLTLPYYFDLLKVHAEVEAVKEYLSAATPGEVEVFIHADPCLPPENCQACPFAACTVRQAPFVKNYPWTLPTVVRDAKHFQAPSIPFKS